MVKSLPTIYQYIALAHRAIWRGDIFLWLAIVLWYAYLPGQRNPSGSLVAYIFVVGISIFHTVVELRHPEPNDLGLSVPKVAEYCFAGFAVLATIGWVVIHASYNIWSDWLWLIVALTFTYATYLVRPRPVWTHRLKSSQERVATV